MWKCQTSWLPSGSLCCRIDVPVQSLYDEGIATAELLFSFRRYVRYMLIYVAGPVVIMMLVLPLFAGGLE